MDFLAGMTNLVEAYRDFDFDTNPAVVEMRRKMAEEPEEDDDGMGGEGGGLLGDLGLDFRDEL